MGSSGNHMVDGNGFSNEKEPLLSFAEQDAQEKVEAAIWNLKDALQDLDDAYADYSEIFGDDPSWAIADAIEKIDDAILDMRRELGL